MNTLNNISTNDQSNDFDFWGEAYQDDNPLLIQRGRFNTLADLLASVNKSFNDDFEQLSSDLLASRM